MATMPKEWSKIVEDNDEILAIMRQNPCLPIVPPHLARVAAKEHAVAPLIRL